MKIEKIILENFRGFKGEHTIELDPQLNVFVGRNGAGKSSILDALGVLLNHFIILGYHIGENLTFSKFNITNGIKGSRLKFFLDFKLENRNEHQFELKVFTNGSFNLPADKPIYKKLTEVLIQDSKYPVPLIRYFRLNQNQIENDKQVFSLFPPHEDERTQIYKTSFSSSNDFETFTNWFINEENEENRIKVKTRNLDYINPKLHPVRAAIERFFGHFPNSDFSGITGEEEQDDTYLSPLTIKKNNKHINLNQLSDGEKQIILYVADIASRLSIANPGLKDTNQGYGVVLIDEIEAHLHPSWQRNIIPALTGTFPNIQFFMTTHSPQVISNVKRENIKIIEDFKIVENTPHSYGRDANNILYNIFGVEERLPQIQEKLDKLYDLIDDEKANGAAKKLMTEIKDLLGDDDPEVQRANTYLEFNS